MGSIEYKINRSLRPIYCDRENNYGLPKNKPYYNLYMELVVSAFFIMKHHFKHAKIVKAQHL